MKSKKGDGTFAVTLMLVIIVICAYILGMGH